MATTSIWCARELTQTYFETGIPSFSSARIDPSVFRIFPSHFYSLFPIPYSLPYHKTDMPYFLFKTEPDVYSFDDFLRDKETIWDNVTNPQAVKYLREMPKGTKWIFYHTGDERTAVGTGTVLSVDPTDPKVPIVKVKVGKKLKTSKTLAQIKAEPLFAQSPLVIIGRLSVVPLTEDQWRWFLD